MTRPFVCRTCRFWRYGVCTNEGSPFYASETARCEHCHCWMAIPASAELRMIAGCPETEEERAERKCKSKLVLDKLIQGMTNAHDA